jgi:hypothetical protein
VEHVLDDHDGAAALLVGSLVGMLVLLAVAELAHADAYAELLATVGTLEHQRLAVFILRLVEGDILFAFRASYSLQFL